jgi:hypothetical protein
MPEQSAQQGQAAVQGSSPPSAGPAIPKGRASSRSTLASSRSSVLGVGIAGALVTVAAIAAGVMMMAGSAPAPVTTQVAAMSAPVAIAPSSTVAPVMVPAPVAPPPAVAPATNFAPPIAPVAAPPIAPPAPQFQPAPPLKGPGQCELGQMQTLSMDISATKRMEVGNVIRIFSGSYVSPPILVTRTAQTVTFPAPPGSNGFARIIVEQKTTGGWTFDEEVNGISTEVERQMDAHHDLIVLRWQHC